VSVVEFLYALVLYLEKSLPFNLKKNNFTFSLFLSLMFEHCGKLCKLAFFQFFRNLNFRKSEILFKFFKAKSRKNTLALFQWLKFSDLPTCFLASQKNDTF